MEIDQDMIDLYARYLLLQRKLVKIKAEIDNIREQIKLRGV